MSKPSNQPRAIEAEPSDARQSYSQSTEPQREIWTALQLNPDASLAYNESITMELVGPLDRSRLCEAVQALPRFHELLTARFSEDGEWITYNEAKELFYQTDDLRLSKDREAAIRQASIQETTTPFDLVRGPLVRFRLLILSDTHHLLLISGHHIVLDGWSLGVLVKDVFAFYRQITSGEFPAKLVQHNFSDYASLETKSAQHLSYWQQKFQVVPSLDLPLKASRPKQRSFRAEAFHYRFAASTLTAAKAAARKERSSFVNYCLSAFSLVLQQLSGQRDIVIGLPAAGQAIHNLPEMVGHAVNLLPLLYHVDLECSWRDYLAHNRSQFAGDWEHNQITFGQLLQVLPIKRDPSRIPLVPVVFNIDTKIPKKDLTLEGLTANYRINPRQFESFELFINCVDADDALEICCQYNADLFHPSLIHSIFAGFERLLSDTAARPTSPLGSFALLTEEAALAASLARPVPLKAYSSLPQMIGDQAGKNPHRLALVTETVSLTYADLIVAVKTLAARLVAFGIKPHDRVGICLPRGADLVTTMIAVQSVGATYVPLDPMFPKLRLSMIAEDAELSCIICDQSTREVLPKTTKTFSLSELPPIPAGVFSPSLPDAEALAYIIFTSGSTGRPKGVMISQGSVVNFLQGMAEAIDYDSSRPLLAVTTVSFDISVLEIFMPLCLGGTVVLASAEAAKDGYQLNSLIEQHAIGIMQATPTTWKILLLAGYQPKPGFVAICGGEPLPRSLAVDLSALGVTLWNAYGPTEATVWATVALIKDGQAPITVGSVLPNYQAWIVDRQGRVQPRGVKGELVLAGPGLAHGYFARDELTLDRFVIDYYGRRLYLTGDLARITEEGKIELFGRNDAQVKVRGYRIELGDIKVAIESHADVHEAIVDTEANSQGELDLVAYVRFRAGTDHSPDSLKSLLKNLLPAYMIPQRLCLVEAFPLLPNGKIDRAALRQSLGGVSNDAKGLPFAARSPEDKVLLELWSSLLNKSEVLADDDFFIHGGHSLLAMQFVSKLNAALGLELRLHHLLQNPTISALAELISSVARPQSSAIPPRAASDKRVSLAQKRMWFVEQADVGTKVHNLPGAWRLSGPLDAALFQQAFARLLQRHEALRMVIKTVDNEPAQYREDRPYALPMVDLSAEKEAKARCFTLMSEAANQHLPIDKFPLFAAALYRLSASEHVFFFMPNHIIWDGWSFDILLDELQQIYLHLKTGATLADLPSATYGDFSSWQSARLDSPAMQEHLDYWRRVYQDLPATLELPQDKARPPVFTGQAEVVSTLVKAETLKAIEDFCKQQGSTPYLVVLAAYALTLSRYSGQKDMAIGTPVRGRHHPDLERMLGVFINLVPLRITMEDKDTFVSLCKKIKDHCSQAFAHDELPFELLTSALDIKRDLSRSPLFSAILSYQDVTGRALAWGEVTLEQVRVDSPVTPTDLFFWVKKGQNHLQLGLDYYSGLWTEQSAAAFLDVLENVLVGALRAPEHKLSSILTIDLEELPPAMGHSSLVTGRERDIISYLRAHRAESGTHTAVHFYRRSLSHDEMWRRAAVVAQSLHKNGATQANFIGIGMERSENLLPAILGIWLLGKAYVPLDPKYPTDRLAFMIKDGGLRHVIIDEEWQDGFPKVEGTSKLFIEDLILGEALTTPVLAAPDDPAYMIYTSGSTGLPKGVVISNKALVHFLRSVQQAIPFPSRMSTLALTTISFDISLLELFVTLARGGTIHLLDQASALQADKLNDYLKTHAIDLVQATPASWRMLVQANFAGSPNLMALTGGESLAPDLASRILGKVRALYNVYGPTEATVWATASHITSDTVPITIGKPLPGYQAWVLDEQRYPLAPGIPGDLFLAGEALATRYHARPELTEEKFITAPWNPQLRLYDTGDRARYNQEGELVYLGRRDTQVKLRGFRIELQEIERQILLYAGIHEAVVMVREDVPGDQRLVAYIVAKGELDVSALKEHLKAILPQYMIPNIFQSLPQLPLTANGKVDRKKLPAPELQSMAAIARDLPTEGTEAVIAKVWAELLKVPQVYADDNFFDLGGHSLLALDAIQRIKQATGQHVLVRDILLQNLRQVAASLVSTGGPT